MKCPSCYSELSSIGALCERCGTQPTLTHASVTLTTGPASAQFQTSPWRKGDAYLEAEIGATIANRYKILARIGTGGMGAVYKVLDLTLDRVVALKTVRPEMANDADILESFKKELILARQVTNKNVCRVFDLGEDHGTYFITMELVEGESLSKIIRAKQKCRPAQAAEIMLQVANG